MCLCFLMIINAAVLLSFINDMYNNNKQDGNNAEKQEHDRIGLYANS